MYLFIPVILCALLFIPFEAQAAYILQNGKIFNKEEVATLSVQEHYSMAMEAYEKQRWDVLLQQSNIISKSFPGTPFADEAIFYSGVAYFNLHDYEFSNRNFSDYLKKLSAARHFEESIGFKFAIAEQFRTGARKHMLGWKKMPKLLPARELAINIYDEVIAALPSSDFAAQSLFGKAELLLKNEDYRACIEAYQTLIRRFPKHALAPESYLGIEKVYLKQCQTHSPDPTFLDLAEINFRKFTLDFPGESRHEMAQQILNEMKEIYAKALFEVGSFFERTKKNNAAFLYYSHVIEKYPGTLTAIKLGDKVKKMEAELKAAEKKLEPVTQAEPATPVEAVIPAETVEAPAQG